MNLKLTDQEAGYYVGIAYYAKKYVEMIEELQEKGVDPYKIIDAILYSNAKLQIEAMEILKLSGHEVKDDTN